MDSSPGSFASFIPLLILLIPFIFICRKWARDKGLNVTKYTILACIPGVNYFAILYLIGATNKKTEAKLDELLALIKKETAS